MEGLSWLTFNRVLDLTLLKDPLFTGLQACKRLRRRTHTVMQVYVCSVNSGAGLFLMITNHDIKYDNTLLMQGWTKACLDTLWKWLLMSNLL